MAAAIGEQSFTQRSSIRRDYSDVSLPCIVGRLTKLEAEGSSYDELLHDFASRRRVAPVKERRSVNKVADPAQETDEIVQAYLSLTRGDCLEWATRRGCGRNPRIPHDLQISRAATVDRPQTRPTTRDVGKSTLWQEGVDDSCVPFGNARKRSHVDAIVPPENTNTDAVVKNLLNKCDRQFALGLPEDQYDGNGRELRVRESRHGRTHYALGGDMVDRDHWATATDHTDRSGLNTPTSLCSSADFSLGHQDSFNYYPSRAESAEALVSLISPRTSKKIRRLPTPGQNEQQKLQRVEHAARTFSTQALELRTKGGLYSTLTRRDVGLTDTDIDGLMATVTDQTEVLAVAKRTAVAESIANHSDGVLSRLLEPKKTPPLPTVNPRCFLGPAVGSSPSTETKRPTHPFPKRRSKWDGHEARHRVGGGELGSASEVTSEESLRESERIRISGAEEREHRENLSSSLRRLRVLLGGGPPGSQSPFSISELRMLGAAKRRRPESGGGVGRKRVHGDEHVYEVEEKATQGIAEELSLEGNPMLRQLAITLMSSVQCKIENRFLLLGFRRWQAVVQSFSITTYLEATVLLQSYMRRTVAIMEASERRRLRDDQVLREKHANELVVRRRQQAALKLQKWIRGETGRRRAAQKLLMLRAARVVQRTIRAKNSRVVALKQREETQRCRRAASIIQRRVRDTRKRKHAVLMQKVEQLKEKELLLQQRCYEIQQEFRREGAAIRIQAVWRARVLKRNLNTFVKIGKRKRAIRIQRAVRGFLARRELQRRRKAFENRFANEIAAAIKIQSLGRRGIAWNKVDERRFQRNRDQLVSTLDAERALRDRKREVPILKAMAAREGTILAATGKGKPYIVDPVALKVMIADKKRSVNPWQDSTDRKAATKIQALWRGYRQMVRVRRMRVRQRREKAQRRRVIQSRGVQHLQRMFRGRRGRLEAKSRRYGLRAVRIQKVWRGFQGKRLAGDRRQRFQAATLLQRRLRGAQARSLANRMRREAVTTRAPAIKIQSTGRRYLARRRRFRLVTEKQIEWEWNTMAKEMARFCAERARLRVIVEGAAAPSCKGDGVTQHIFRKLAIKRSGEEGSGSLRLEGRAFVKLFAGTPGVFRTSFNATDADLIFARVKDKEERTITYVQFAAGLNIVAVTLFPEVKRFREFRAFKAKAARLLELVEATILQAPGATGYRQFCQKSGDRYLDRSAGKIQAAARGCLGRKRFRRKRAERDREARAAIEGIMVVRIQALARRFCARCLAIRIAQARIAKYIDPTTTLPYWVHPGTGVTSWTKPKIFGAQDAEHATMVATSKTEHLVKCSICDERRVTRLCKSCRDGYCDECFLALHGKGHRREHIAPTVPMCCVCEYQHGSRLCETCTFKTSRTCAYCDVCFFSRHPGLDLRLMADERKGTMWRTETNAKQTGWDHRWTPLVVTCMECRRYAARWLCDDCEEVYCVGCYASVHRHGTKVNHGAEKLPYYTADFHMEYAMACRKQSRAEKEEEAGALWLDGQERKRQRAATLIQAGWRGRIGRVKGRELAKAGRVEQREAWRQRKRDDVMRKALWYEALDLAGVAPALKSDTVEEQALRRVPRLARKTPKKYIALNREDDAWVPGKLDGRKGTIKRGFEVGELAELKDQARRGGVRLPGRHAVITGHRSIYTDPTFEMKDFVKPKQIVRVEGEIFRVEAVLPDRIRVDHVWHKSDAKDVLLYKMVLTKKQKLLQGATRAFWSSQPVQYAIQMAIVVEEDVFNNAIRQAAMRCKKKRRKKLYGLAKKTLKSNEGNIRSLKLMLNTAQFGLDRPLAADQETDKGQGGGEGNAASTDAVLGWIEKRDEATGRPVWQNEATGEITFARPSGYKEREKLLEELALQKDLLVAKRARRKR